jgi:hypothetical protein
MMVLLIFLFFPVPIILLGEEVGQFMYWAWRGLMAGTWTKGRASDEW